MLNVLVSFKAPFDVGSVAQSKTTQPPHSPRSSLPFVKASFPPYESLNPFIDDCKSSAVQTFDVSEIAQPTPPQHALQLSPYLLRPRKPNSARNLPAPSARQLVPSGKHCCIDYIRTNAALDSWCHLCRRLRRRRRHAVRLGVKARVVRQRCYQLRHKRAQPAVRGLGERA